MSTTLTSYYKFQRTTGKSRYDCIESTFDYPHFENILRNKIKYNVGGLSLNLGEVPEYFNNVRHRATQAITRGSNISKLFLFDLQNPCVFYGDAQDTDDCLIIVCQNNEIEIFVAKGLKGIQQDVCYEFLNGGLFDEIEAVKQRAREIFIVKDVPEI